MDADQWRRYVRLSVAEGALATAMGTLLSGVFLTGFALSLGANRLAIGILAALPALASLAQLVGARLIERGVSRKRLTVRALSAARLLWLAVLGIPLLSAAGELGPICGLLALVGLSSLFSSLGGVASLSWTREMVPTEQRLGFLGLKHQFNSILALVLSIAGACFIDWWNYEHPGSSGGFMFVLMSAVVCGLVGISVLGRIEEPAAGAAVVPAPEAKSTVRGAPLKDRNFRSLIYFYICWNLASNLAAPFFAVFMLQNLGLPFWQIAALQTFFSMAGLVANRHWTALGKRVGTRPVVFLATLGEAFYPLCWIFITPEATWALPLVFLFGAFGTPLAVGAPTLLMKLAPNELASSYLGTFNAMMGVVMAIAAVAGGYLATHVAVEPVTVGGISMEGLKFVFLISFVGRIGSLWLLRRVHEPGAADTWSTVQELTATFIARWRSDAIPSAAIPGVKDPGEF
jgi:Major Facilitator Superfamily